MWCYACGGVVEATEAACPACGGRDLSGGLVRPARAPRAPEAPTRWPWPWSRLAFPTGFTMVLAGARGLGKSSIGALLKPTLWLTNEMEPAAVGQLLVRVAGPGDTLVGVVEAPAQVDQALAEVEGGVVVIDSLAEFGLEQAVQVLRAARGWAQRCQGRVVAINQVASDGKGAGREALEHIADVVAYIRGDDAGRRRLDVVKCRAGPLFSAAWVFDTSGKVRPPILRHAYSVEGAPGAYRLVPVPSPNTHWAEVYRHLTPNTPIEGTASCGRRWPAYASGWLLPEDVEERRAFAEAHGLVWIDPPEVPT